MTKINLPRVNNVLRLVCFKGTITDVNTVIVSKLGPFSLGEETSKYEK